MSLGEQREDEASRQLEHHEHQPAPHHGRRVDVLLAGLTNPLNVGHAFRTCLSLGVGRLYLCDGTPAPPSSKINRTSRGAQHELPWEEGATLDTIRRLRAAGQRVIAIEYATHSEDLRGVLARDASESSECGCVLVLGNEAHGLSSEVLAACDAVAHIPLFGTMSSLNVSVALTVAVWEAVRA